MRPVTLPPDQASQHFTPETLKFLRGLARNNNRDWFEARRGTYERVLRAPMLQTIAHVNEAMLAFAPEHVKPPEKTVLRIYRDTRFSQSKLPYKQQYAAWWGRADMPKTSGAGFYFHLSAKNLHVAAGLFMPDPGQTLLFRRYLLDHHAEFRAMLEQPRLTARMRLADPQALTRAPKGFPPDHPALDLLRARNWGVEAEMPPEQALNNTFPAMLAEYFQAAASLVDTLNQPLTGAPKELPVSKDPVFTRSRA